ncbi:MAG: hypothetical protein L0I76_13745 [Pseudonocardia sp.]|nr:hypothetical protein [Pseudonocardia sp.]
MTRTDVDKGTTLDVHTVIAQRLPGAGPYGHEQTSEAARSLRELADYLAQATDHGEALPDPVTVDNVLRGLQAAARDHRPLLEHLAHFADAQSGDRTLNDDRPDRDVRDTIGELSVVLGEADHAAQVLAARLAEATALNAHLRRDDPRAAQQ